MGLYLKKVFTQIRDFLRALTPAKKIAMGVTGVLVFSAIIMLFIWAGDTTYKPLMTNLSAEDQANIIRVLRDKKIPFKIEGKTISIPPEDLFQLRMELATMGLPESSLGYEVFDKQPLGTTSFVQKINQKRALEGELMRTVGTIKGVRRSRVHLAIPQKSAFVEDQKKPSASVVVDLEPGSQLTEKQVFGIGNLVARAVEGMEITDVVIVDSHGKVLSKNPTDTLAGVTATQLEFRQKYEQDLENRIKAMLGRIVGEGRVEATVTADLDFSQVNETQTTYDQDGSAVRSVERDSKSMEGSRPGPYGAVGAVSNRPEAPPAVNGQVRTDTKNNREITNYEVPQTVRRTVRPSWSMKRLSVAVVVDGKMVKTKDKDGNILSKSEPWTPEQLKEFELVVASALGIDRKRGDSLEIKNIEFTREDFEEAQRLIADSERKSYMQNMVLYGIIGITIALFFLLVVRPFIKWVTENTIDSLDSFLPQTLEELERLQKNANLPALDEVVPVLPDKIDPEKVEGEMIKEKIITLVDANPQKAALILHDWLHVAKDKKASEGKGEATA